MNGCYRVIAVVIVMVGSALAARGQNISVSQSMDRTEMAFEDTAAFQITVRWQGPAHRYRFDKPFRLDTDNLKVARYSSSVSSSGQGDQETTVKLFNYALVPTLSGQGIIRPLVIEYSSWPDSTVGELTTDPVTVNIAAKKATGGESGSKVLLYVAAAVVLVGGAAALVLVQMRRRRRMRPAALRPKEQFLDELPVLKRDAGSDLKKFQAGLFKILASYVARQYRLDLTGQPAAHIAARLAEAESDARVRERLAHWLTGAEKDKYAPVTAGPGETLRLEAEIREFFQNLK